MASQAEVLIHIDGASRGNPGPAAYALVMEAPGGEPLASFSKYLGETTNNFAEYQALLAALDYALAHELRRVRVLTDSELVQRQVCGHYKVKSADLKPDEKVSTVLRNEPVLRHPQRLRPQEGARSSRRRPRPLPGDPRPLRRL